MKRQSNFSFHMVCFFILRANFKFKVTLPGNVTGDTGVAISHSRALESCVPGCKPDRFLPSAWITDFLLVVVMTLQSPIGFSLFPACNTQGRIQAHTGNNQMCLLDLADLHGMTASTL